MIFLSVSTGGGVQAADAGDDDDSDDDDSTVRSRVDGSPSLKRNELQTYDSGNSSAGPLAGGLVIPSAATKSNDDPGMLPLDYCFAAWCQPYVGVATCLC